MALNYHYCVGHAKPMRTKSPINVRWNKPEMNWYKLNTDGSAIRNLGKTGGGGIIRDHNGGRISGFSKAIGIATSVEAELWALRDGLKICSSLNLLAVEIELDAKVVMDWVSENTTKNIAHFALISDCRQLMGQIPNLKVKHCYREANQCANRLAKMGATQQ